MGICASGGGVRAGSVALGALQALRAEGLLLRARYLVSVSGGGYMVGAFQQALACGPGIDQPPITLGPTSARPRDVLRPGSMEEDHVRRHSDYLSDGLKQWLVAFGVIFRCLLSALVVIGLVITAAGLLVGRFYRVTRIANGSRPNFRPRNCRDRRGEKQPPSGTTRPAYR